MDYESGYILALIINLIKVIISFAVVNSIRSKNMERIGLHFNHFSNTFDLKEKQSLKIVFLYIFYLLVLSPLFSWLSVIVSLLTFIYQYSKKATIPEKIKEIQFKISNISLSKEQMNELMNEIENALGIKKDNNYNEEELTLKLDTYSELTMNKREKKLYFDTNFDYERMILEVYEFRIEGTKLICRLLEEKDKRIENEIIRVRDNVVLESQIRKLYHKDDIDCLDEINEYRKKVEWHEISRPDIRFFVLSNHPELISKSELKKEVRIVLEKLNLELYNISSDKKNSDDYIQGIKENFNKIEKILAIYLE